MILSYIIPAYNIGSFIEKCLYSIVAQKLADSDYEIIIVDDGSTDNSAEKIQSFVKNHVNVLIKYHYQKNAGQGSARNLALSMASGDYIWFVDADDFLETESAPRLLTVINEKKPEILWFDHRLVDEHYNCLPLPNEDQKIAPPNILYTGEEFLKKYFRNSCMPCMFLFRRKYLLDINLKFEEGKFLEDIIFTSVAIDKCESICYSNVLAYNYLIRESGSTMRDEANKVKRIKDSLYIAKVMKEYSHNANTPHYFKNFASDITIYNLRLSANMSIVFFHESYDFCKMHGLLPVKINGAASTVLTKLALNILGKKFLSIAKKLN